MSIIKSKGQIDGNVLLRAIEEEYLKVLMEVR
jgi:hypothetical protein